MAKIIEPTIADTYGGVAIISAAWIIMAYLFMPLGPIAQMKKASEGQQKWCASVFSPNLPSARPFTLMCSQLAIARVCAGATAPS